jgi:hypothetical protein
MPNWRIHEKWAKKWGIPDKIAEFVNRSIDYGSNWLPDSPQKIEIHQRFQNQSALYRQLVLFYDKDSARRYYVKACYLHYLLDYFKETYIDITNIELVFKKFLQHKAVTQIYDLHGQLIDLYDILSELFQFIRSHKKDILNDLHGR